MSGRRASLLPQGLGDPRNPISHLAIKRLSHHPLLPAYPRLAFVILTPPGDGRLPALLDLLGRQGLAPGEHEILVAAHAPALGVTRAEALSRAIGSLRAPWTWVMDVADRPSVNAAATLLARARQEDLDLVVFRLGFADPARAGRLRYDVPAILAPAPIMDGPALLSRHDFQPELACVLAATSLWRAGAAEAPPASDPVVDRVLMPQLVLRSRRAAFLPLRPILRGAAGAGPDVEAAAATARALRNLVESLKAAGNPSANLATRLLRRAEIVAIEALRGLILAGASADELSLARQEFREAGALPIRHLGRPEATLRMRFWSWVATSRVPAALIAAACRMTSPGRRA